MEVKSIIPDYRIESSNVLVELTIKEYLAIAKEIIDNNEYQRKKVIKGIIRDLLKKDLLEGCTIPSIVLAVKDSDVPDDFNFKMFNDSSFIEKCFENKSLLIIDGLQRTFVLLELEKEIIQGKYNGKEIESFYENKIRTEIYLGLNKLNILYRMLTLNTGQTTMSTRHLMEILYLDLINTNIEGIKLVPDKENIVVDRNNINEFKFKDVLDGFNSYIEKSEILLSRAEILDNVKALKNIEKFQKDKLLFNKFLITLKEILNKFDSLLENIEIEIQDFEDTQYQFKGKTLFGKNIIQIFKKSITFTGLGASIRFLNDKRPDFSINDIQNYITKLDLGSEPKNILLKINFQLDFIREKSKKIGNDQRKYFKHFFRALFDTELSDEYMNFDKSMDYAFKKVREDLDF